MRSDNRLANAKDILKIGAIIVTIVLQIVKIYKEVYFH